jgi:hypothetical protein
MWRVFLRPGNFVVRTYIVHWGVALELRVTRNMSATRREKVTLWRSFNNSHSSLNAIRLIKGRTMRLAVRVKSINAKKRLVGNPEGKRPLGRPGTGWESIQTDRKETRLDFVDWFDLAQDRNMLRAVVDTVMKLKSSIKCGEFLDQVVDCQVLFKDSVPYRLLISTVSIPGVRSSKSYSFRCCSRQPARIPET